jgi:guanylate kinase
MVVVIEGPSGVGKDSVITGLINKYPDKFEKIISVTTRPMRDYEKQGYPYIFVTDEQFDSMLKSGDVFEHTLRHGTKRGMSKKYILEIISQNKIPLKDCDIYGVRALRNEFKNVLTFFITAEKSEIRSRMIKRGDKPEDIEMRLNDYDRYIGQAKYYDYVIENKDLDKTIDKIYSIIL